MTNKKIANGIYLIIDPSEQADKILGKLKQILGKSIAAVQIWDHFQNDIEHYKLLISDIVRLCNEKNVPVIINNRGELLEQFELSGVHYDTQAIAEQNRKYINRVSNIITGITCNNDLRIVEWARDNHLSYISFCSIFPSSTANNCELVKFETIQKAKSIVDIPIFLAGGIKPENLHLLSTLEYSGIAVVSGIMNSNNPIDAVNQYNNNTKKYL